MLLWGRVTQNHNALEAVIYAAPDDERAPFTVSRAVWQQRRQASRPIGEEQVGHEHDKMNEAKQDVGAPGAERERAR